MPWHMPGAVQEVRGKAGRGRQDEGRSGSAAAFPSASTRRTGRSCA